MTSSETRTDSRKKAHKKRTDSRKGKQGKDEPSSWAQRQDGEDSAAGGQAGIPPQVLMLGFALLLVGGWLAIMDINRWYFGPPVFFLCAGWLAVLLTGRFLWTAGMVAAEEDDGTLEEEFWRAEGPADELQREKRSLLKAIKEIEFDREMGKMSDEDAKELTHFYRTRAIQIIKALERAGDEGQLTIEEKIDRELKARLSIAHASAKGKAAAKAKDAAEQADAKKADAKKADAKKADAKKADAKKGESPAAKARKALEEERAAAADDESPDISSLADQAKADDGAEELAREPELQKAEVGS